MNLGSMLHEPTNQVSHSKVLGSLIVKPKSIFDRDQNNGARMKSNLRVEDFSRPIAEDTAIENGD